MAPVVVLLVTFRRFICNFELTLVVSRFRLRARFLSPLLREATALPAPTKPIIPLLGQTPVIFSYFPFWDKF